MKKRELSEEEFEEIKQFYLALIVLPKAIKLTLKNKPKCYAKLLKNIDKITNKPKFFIEFKQYLKDNGLSYNPSIIEPYKIRNL